MAEVDDHWQEWQKEIATRAADTTHAPKRPNILFIFSDDHAQHALSCYGSKVNSTPHLDRLAAAGARFTNSFVTNSICTPSRATLLTGQYSHANGVPVFNAFDGSRDHVAKHLQRAGYHTGMVGKWHLGTDPTGFDRWIVLPGQGAYQNPSFLVPGSVLSIDGHCTDITTDLGIEFLKTRPRDKPFFLMLHHKAPHREWEPDARNKAKFKDAVFPEPATLFDDYATRPTALPANKQTIARDLTNRDLKLDPPAKLTGKERNEWLSRKPDSIEAGGATLTGKDAVRWKYQQFMRDYLACVQGVDDSVGRMLDELERQGLADDTIVIYSTDNGWYLGDLGLYDKRFMYEPGLKTPLLARGPGIQEGLTPDAFVANIDLAPTFLDLAGVPVPDSMQGRSLAPLLRGEKPADWRQSVYYRYYHDPGDHDTRAHYGVRTKTHKLIHYFKQGSYELFDLVADPHEQRNLLFNEAEAKSPQVAALFADLKAELERLQRDYGDDDRYADPATWPQGTVNGPFPGRTQLGQKTVAEAIAASPAAGPVGE
ncbi:MAG: sulfatase [Planctomycetia bacterium]|nr:sulfatase [Planctomycetia bacterium]